VIDQYAFSDCSSLKAITLPEGLRCIKEFAFVRCSALTSVKFPATFGSTYSTYHIFRGAFSGCDALSRVTLSTNVEVESDAFVQAQYANPGTKVLRLSPVDMRWHEVVKSALAIKRCRCLPLLYAWLERAQTRLGSYGPDGAARKRDLEEFEADFVCAAAGSGA
jgi:hypothetical protein